MDYQVVQLTASDLPQLKELLWVFGQAFNDPDTYGQAIPNDAYLGSLLKKPHFIALVALHEDKVVAGLTAYVLEKFEQDRREIYIYDLAVLAEHRRRGIATKLINELKLVAKKLDAYVIFVQADQGDEAAIRLYESLGKKEDVYHFDIPIN